MAADGRASAVVLAAGFGKRMNSDIPKVLHKTAGRTLLGHVLAAVAPLELDRTIVVVPPDHHSIRATLAAAGLDDGIEYAVQEEAAGTADAIRIGLQALGRQDENILVLPGDHPLLEPQTLEDMLVRHRDSSASATVLTCRQADPTGRGRIVRSDDGTFLRIVEHRDATEEELAIDEVNGGIYVFDGARLGFALGKIDRENAQGEFYLTDVIEILRLEGDVVVALQTDSDDAFGVNSRAHLAQANELLRRRACEKWMERGVTIVDPAVTYIDATVTIGRDTVIQPFTFLEGDATIGERCEIGPQVRIVDSVVGNDAAVSFAVIRGSEVGPESTVGPYASLRPGTVTGRGVHIGTFVETKQAVIADRSSIPHLSYMGDVDIGRGVNIGAGSITCNWDGSTKHRTVIEDDAYVSSDTMLVAPVHLGKRSATGAGAVVRGEVPDDALAVGVPARVIEGKGDKMKRRREDASSEEGSGG